MTKTKMTTDMKSLASIRARLDVIEAEQEKLGTEERELRQASLKIRIRGTTSAVTKFRDIQASSVKKGDVIRGRFDGAKGNLHVVKERTMSHGFIVLELHNLGGARARASFTPKALVTVGR